MKEKKYPVDLLNADDAPHLWKNSAGNMENMRFHAGLSGRAGYFRGIEKNTEITSSGTSQIPAGSKCVGGVGSIEGNYLVWFTHCPTNPNNDQINFFDMTTKTWWLVLRSNMGPGKSLNGGLLFKNYIHSVRIINGFLFWTDNNEEPRKLHLGAAMRATSPSLDTPLYEGWQYDWTEAITSNNDKSNITIISKPLAYAPKIIKVVDPTFENNFIYNTSFQFAVQYEFYSGERSILSQWSISSMLNTKKEEYNAIDVFLQQDNMPVPPNVRFIHLCVRYFESAKFFRIKSWDKEVTTDKTLIDGFISGSPLSYRFYNSYLGIGLDDNMANKPFENVPLKSEGLEVADNRVMLSRNTEGYDTPKKTSMALANGDENEVTSFSSFQKVYHIGFRGRTAGDLFHQRFTEFNMYVKLDIGSTHGYYLIPGTEASLWGYFGWPPIPPVPASVNLGDLVYKGATLDEVRNNTLNFSYKIFEEWIHETTDTIEVLGLFDPGDQDIAISAFPHNIELQAGSVFYDKYLRKCGVVTNDTVKTKIPERDYTPKYINEVGWTLSNADALTEIPIWAEYYAPVLRKYKGKTFFQTGFCDQSVKYAAFDADGNYDYSNTTYVLSLVAIALDTTSLLNAGLGYTFAEGDQCLLIKDDNTKYRLSVIGQSGQYILVQPKDIGDVSASKFVFEIYTPDKYAGEDNFFEQGQLYKVLNAGRPSRIYSVTSGKFLPDTWLIPRLFEVSGVYWAFAMSPNDLYWKKWVTHSGRSTPITTLGQAIKNSNIRFSNVWIPGTRVDGLSNFDALNEAPVPPEMGPIRKIILTSKVQGKGTVLLAICENETSAIYLGETELLDQNEISFIAKSGNVIGKVNILKGNKGTSHPSSVREIDGNVHWYCHRRKTFVKYSVNGLFETSSLKLIKASAALARWIDAQTDPVDVRGGIDAQHKEYLVQVLVIPNEAPLTCAIPTNLSHVEEEDAYPYNSTFEWDFDGTDGYFDWQLTLADGFIIEEGSNYYQATSPGSVTVGGLVFDTDYIFRIRKKCFEGVYSEWVEMPFTLPEPPCIPMVAIRSSGTFNGAENVPFSAVFARVVSGTLPVTISDVTKPAWMTLSQDGSGNIIGSGTPGIGDAATDIDIEFTLTGCDGNEFDVIQTMAVTPATGVVKVVSSQGGTQITNVTGITGFTFDTAHPVHAGEQQTGTHGAFTGTISVTFTGTLALNPGNISITKNGIEVFHQTVTSAGTYTSSSLTFTSSDYIQISLNLGA